MGEWCYSGGNQLRSQRDGILLVSVPCSSFLSREGFGIFETYIPLIYIAPGGILPNNPTWAESYAKAQQLVSQLSLPAKVNLTTGTGWAHGFCVGSTGPAYSLDGSKLLFPALCLQDGPLGLRFTDHTTAWPAGLTTGATWNRELIRERGRLHGLEARSKGINVILGPAMGPLGRMPAGGRNWEGFGSDPYLQGVAASETIKGIQSEGVIATAKHYICMFYLSNIS